MKLCKLKMEADKTEAELQVKQMEKTLHTLQNGHSSQVRVRTLTQMERTRAKLTEIVSC